jgi:hypothetical protein
MCWCDPRKRTPCCGPSCHPIGQECPFCRRRPTQLQDAPPGASHAPCVMCGRSTLTRVVVGDGWAPFCGGGCHAFWLGCIVGAAIVAWGDAMRGMMRFREPYTWVVIK